jgi:hypothetical protein
MIEFILVFCAALIAYYFVFFYKFSPERKPTESNYSESTGTSAADSSYWKDFYVPSSYLFTETKTFQVKRKRNKRIVRIPLYIKRKR